MLVLTFSAQGTAGRYTQQPGVHTGLVETMLDCAREDAEIVASLKLEQTDGAVVVIRRGAAEVN
jgi:hypothetical protein